MQACCLRVASLMFHRDSTGIPYGSRLFYLLAPARRGRRDRVGCLMEVRPFTHLLPDANKESRPKQSHAAVALIPALLLQVRRENVARLTLPRGPERSHSTAGKLPRFD